MHILSMIQKERSLSLRRFLNELLPSFLLIVLSALSAFVFERHNIVSELICVLTVFLAFICLYSVLRLMIAQHAPFITLCAAVAFFHFKIFNEYFETIKLGLNDLIHHLPISLLITIIILISGTLVLSKLILSFFKQHAIRFLTLFALILGFQDLLGVWLKTQRLDFNSAFEMNRADTARPDIYILLADGYTSNASLLKNFKYVNGSFSQWLKSHKFNINNEAKCNYNITAASLASLFSLNYIGLKNGDLLSERQRKQCIEQGIKKSSLVRLLEQRSYKIKIVSPLLNEKLLPVPETTAPLDVKTLKNTPVGYYAVNNKWDKYYKNCRTMQGFDDYNRLLANLQISSAGPVFFFKHYMVTHPPYTINKTCVEREKISPADKYLSSIEIQNKYFEQDIISIKQRPHPRGYIVILLADHGSHITESDNIFMAYYTSDKSLLASNPQSSVSLMRLLFSQLKFASLPALPDKTFNVGYENF
jgi:hypothetical protein